MTNTEKINKTPIKERINKYNLINQNLTAPLFAKGLLLYSFVREKVELYEVHWIICSDKLMLCFCTDIDGSTFFMSQKYRDLLKIARIDLNDTIYTITTSLSEDIRNGIYSNQRTSSFMKILFSYKPEDIDNLLDIFQV